MNSDMNSSCYIRTFSHGGYEIDEDDEGRSVLTGSNMKSRWGLKVFTVEELEVFLVTP